MEKYKKPHKQVLWTDENKLKLMDLVGTMSIEDLAIEFNCKVQRIKTQCSNQKLSYRFKEN